MKLLKKVLAAALAGVLALSVLTGCNNSVATVTMVDALNDWSKFYGDGITFEKGNEDLQGQVNALVKIVDDAGKKIDFKDAKNIYDMYEAVMDDEAAMLKLKEWAGQFSEATIDDKNSPLYQYGFADISATLSASSKNIYYANELAMTSRDINAPDEEWNEGERNWDYGSEAVVAVATGEIKGKKYMVALFKTTAVTNPDYKPNPDKPGKN